MRPSALGLAAALPLLVAAAAAPPADGASGLERLSPPEAGPAVAAARAGLAQWLSKIPAAQSASYGFSSPEEIARARLAPPYRLVVADAKGEALAPTDEWRFPVTVDGQFRALLTVARVDGAYKPVGFGAAELARELSRLERDRAVAPASRRLLLRLFAVRADFVSYSKATLRLEEAPFTPLASARALASGSVPVPDGSSAARLLPWARERRTALSR